MLSSHVPIFPHPFSTWSFYSAYICKNSTLCPWGSLLVPPTIKNKLSGVLFPGDSVSAQGESHWTESLAIFTNTAVDLCMITICRLSLGFWRPRNTFISLKELNLHVIQICSLNEFRPVICKCPPNFQSLRSDA